MGIVIDTSALVAVERKPTDLSATLSLHGAETVVLPVIAWAELLSGVRLAKDPVIVARRRAFLEQIRLNIALVPFDDLVAEHYADIFAECLKTGTPIPQNDIAVAATARHLRYSLLVGSKDENHFRNVKGLDVIVLVG